MLKIFRGWSRWNGRLLDWTFLSFDFVIEEIVLLNDVWVGFLSDGSWAAWLLANCGLLLFLLSLWKIHNKFFVLAKIIIVGVFLIWSSQALFFIIKVYWINIILGVLSLSYLLLFHVIDTIIFMQLWISVLDIAIILIEIIIRPHWFGSHRFWLF